ncbi:hypothetical protein IW261DRAFT_1527133, partial [Armillaria novae-zelandiae]
RCVWRRRKALFSIVCRIHSTAHLMVNGMLDAHPVQQMPYQASATAVRTQCLSASQASSKSLLHHTLRHRQKS